MTVTEMPAVHETHFTLTLRADSDPACRLRLEESSPDVWMIADADELVADPRLPVLRFGEHAAPTVLHLEVDCIGPAAVIADDAEVRIGFDVGAGGLVPGDLTVPDGWTASPVADDGGAPSVSISRHGAPVVWPLQITISATLGGCQEGDRGSVDVALVGFHDDGSPGPDHFSGVPLYVYLSEAAPPNAGRPELRLSPQWVKDQDVVIASVSLDDGDMIRNRLAFTLQCPRSEGGDDVEDPYLPTITLSLPYTDSDNSLLLGAFCTVDALETSPPQLQVTSSSGERWVTKRIGLDQAETAAWTAQPRRPLCLEAGTTLTFIMDDLVCSPMPGEAEQFVSSPLHIEWASPVHRRTSTSLMVTAYPPIILENFTASSQDSDLEAATGRRWVDLGWDVNHPDLADRYELTVDGNDDVHLVSPRLSATSTRMAARIAVRDTTLNTGVTMATRFRLRAVPRSRPPSGQHAPEVSADLTRYSLSCSEEQWTAALAGHAQPDPTLWRLLYRWTPDPLPPVVAELRLRVRTVHPIVRARAVFDEGGPGLELIINVGFGDPAEATLMAMTHGGEVIEAVCLRASYLPVGGALEEHLGTFSEEIYPLEGACLTAETGQDTQRCLLDEGRQLIVHRDPLLSSGSNEPDRDTAISVVYRWDPDLLPPQLSRVQLKVQGRDAMGDRVVIDEDVHGLNEFVVKLDRTRVQLDHSSLLVTDERGNHRDAVLRNDLNGSPQVIKTVSALCKGMSLSYLPTGRELDFSAGVGPARSPRQHLDVVPIDALSHSPGVALKPFSIAFEAGLRPVFRGDPDSINLDGAWVNPWERWQWLVWGDRQVWDADDAKPPHRLIYAESRTEYLPPQLHLNPRTVDSENLFVSTQLWVGDPMIVDLSQGQITHFWQIAGAEEPHGDEERGMFEGVNGNLTVCVQVDIRPPVTAQMWIGCTWTDPMVRLNLPRSVWPEHRQSGRTEWLPMTVSGPGA